MYFSLSYFLQGLVLHSQRPNKDFKYMNGESRRAVKLEPRTPGIGSRHQLELTHSDPRHLLNSPTSVYY